MYKYTINGKVCQEISLESGVLKEAEARAAKANSAFVPCRGVTVAADEIFDGAQPHLVMVEPFSLLLVELSRQEKRDSLRAMRSTTPSTTWGVTFLECAKACDAVTTPSLRGMKIQQVVSDGAQGFHP